MNINLSVAFYIFSRQKLGSKDNFSGTKNHLKDPIELVYYDQLANQSDPIFLTIRQPESEETFLTGSYLPSNYDLFV